MIECRNGFTYDKEWYEATIATKENWICERDLYVTNTFVVSRAFEVIGSFALGQIGDTGRG
uniref:Uncharacterized protein n=1 Tax=Megaselia scalaris TaxID=36166 RepID=T1GFB9_MEGSC